MRARGEGCDTSFLVRIKGKDESMPGRRYVEEIGLAGLAPEVNLGECVV